MPSTVVRHRFTVEEYYRMGEAGVFTEGSRVELLDGEIFAMTPIGSRHAACVTELQRLLAPVWQGCVLRSQQPLRLDDHSEPEPDVCVVVSNETAYADRHPVPAEVLLLVEVSDRSLRHDRERKLPRYASAGIFEVWIVDLGAERVEVYREPVGDRYRLRRTHERGEIVAPLAFPTVRLPINGFLP